MIGVGSDLEIWQTGADTHGHFVSLKGLDTWGKSGDLGGFFVDRPSEMFHLSRGKDGLSVRHVGTVTDDEDDGSHVSVNVGSGLNQGQISDSVVINAVEVGEGAMTFDDPHVGANNAAVGSTVDKSIPFLSQVAGVVAHRVRGRGVLVIVRGRRNLRRWSRLTVRPAIMCLVRVVEGP